MYASRFNDGHWAFFGPGEESKWYQGRAVNCGGKWDHRASQMVEEFENSGHPVFKMVSPLGRGTLKMKSGRSTIHCNGECDNIDLLHRTGHAANQLCIYDLRSSHVLKRQVKADPKVLEEHPEKFKSSRKNSSDWLIFRD